MCPLTLNKVTLNSIRSKSKKRLIKFAINLFLFLSLRLKITQAYIPFLEKITELFSCFASKVAWIESFINSFLSTSLTITDV